MRTVPGVLVGVVGACVAVALLGTGFGITRQAMTRYDLTLMPVGALMLLAGGAVVGVLVGLARRSRWVPGAAGAVLLVAGAYALVDPLWAYDLGRGVGDLVATQLATVLAGVLLAGTVAAGRPRDGREPGPAAPHPSWGAPPPSGPIVH
ncbi:hypothetical protein SAMN05216207_102939 [Pseudonocardia ammonioxydans]|uniref:Uncharacterized protein n=1 Tax=Pseudonocardia ammonioxydans TaxID=260086 RepID=A0A1I5E5V8_PSUAM|nr:hypothetical protein [Pseudonocardia ammonioxydans]SFO06884.1 hypothetical protein SAMN05216207_102939 [Pseudonocardia ammonioxydans]